MIDHAPHVSDLRWDRLLAGDLPDADRDAALAHAAACPTCAARHRALEAEHAVFATRAPAFAPRDDLAAARARRTARTTWIVSLGAIAAAAVIVLFAMRRGEPARGEQTKGGDGPALVLAVERTGRLAPLQAGDVLHPGDRVQATYGAKVDGYGAVLSRDGAGAVNAYVPSAGDAMVPLPAGTDASFPESTILDDVTGGERIAIVWCREAQPLAPLLATLRAGAPLVAPPGCTVRELALAKQATR